VHFSDDGREVINLGFRRLSFGLKENHATKALRQGRAWDAVKRLRPWAAGGQWRTELPGTK